MPFLHLLCHSFYFLFMCMKRQFCCLSCLWHSLCQVQAWTVLCTTGVSCSIMLLFSGLFLVLRMNHITDFCIFKVCGHCWEEMGLKCSILQLWSFGIGYLNSIPWCCIQRCFNSFLWCDCFWVSIRDDCNFCYTIGSIHCSSITICWASCQSTFILSRYFFQFSMSWSPHPSLCLFGYGASNVVLRYNGHLRDWTGMVLIH